MGYIPLGAGSPKDDDAPRTYVNPPEMINHLLLIWPIWYETDTYTQYPRQDGKPSDAVYVDIVDLSMADENGYAGKLMRNTKWTQGRLIRDTKNACGTQEPMLAQMTIDGKAYQLVEQKQNPGSVSLADAWRAAHPDFVPSQPGQVETAAPEPPRPTSAPPAPPVPSGPQTSAVMDRLRQASQSGYRPGTQHPLPPPAPKQEQETEPPF